MKARAMLRAIALVAALGLVAGCMNATFTTGAPRGNVTTYQRHHFFLWGFVGEGIVQADLLCPQGIASVRTFASGVDLILGLITAGLYSPRTTEVVCAGGPGYASASRYLVGSGEDGKTLWVVEAIEQEVNR